MIETVGVGDVLAVDSGSWVGDIVKFGEWVAGQEDCVSHVIIAHHQDKRGRWWGIEGRPGGVGWQQLDHYLDNTRHAKHDNSNGWQTRTFEQRVKIAKAAEGMLGVGYDWVGGIIADAFGALKARELAEFADKLWGWERPRPGRVVCSSLAAWIYGNLGLPHPEVPGETTTPADWWLFNHQGKV